MFQKILVTGATGFLGGHVTDKLLASGYQVRATGRNSSLLNKLHHDKLETITADLSSYSQCQRVMKDCDAIIHCAALAAPYGNKIDFIKSNVISTQNLASLAVEKNIKRFVHISTPSIYIGMQKKLNIKENDILPKKFVSHYASTKYEAEKIIDAFSLQGLNAITLRPQGLFGPKDTVLVPRLLAANQKTGIPIINGGTHLIDLTYIDNVVHGVLLALHAQDIYKGKKYNISNNSPVEFKVFMTELLDKLNIKPNFKSLPLWLGKSLAYGFEWTHKLLKLKTEPPLNRYTITVLSQSRTLDISKAMQDLNYRPSISIEEGLDRFVKWWKIK